MITTLLSPLLGLALALTGFLGIDTQKFGAFSDPFLSVQLATNPSNGNCLTTDGTNNIWSAGCGGSGGSDPFTHPSAGQSATTSLMLFNGQASSTLFSANTGFFNFINATGTIGLSSSTPWGRFSINPVAIDGAAPWFVIGSTTGGTKFVIDNTGTTTSSNGFNITGGCFSINNNCISGGAGGGSASTTLLTDLNAWSARQNFNGNASTTGLTVTGSTYLATAGGNVGIGTTSPFAKLSVVGDGVFTSNLSTANFTATGTATFSGLSQGVAYIGSNNLLQTAASSSIFGFIPISNQLTKGYFLVGDDSGVAQATSTIFISSTGKVGIASTTPYAKFAITNTSADPSFIVEDSASPDSSPFIIDASGNVGIGTTGPGYKLDIVSDTSSDGIMLSGTGAKQIYIDGGTSASFIADRSSTSQEAKILFSTAGTGKAALGLDNDTTDYLHIGNSDLTTKWVTVNTTNGNVGIGTTGPLHPLEVAGAFGTGTEGIAIYNTSAKGGGNASSLLFKAVNGFSSVATLGYVQTINTHSTGDALDSALTFGTAKGAVAATEKMRIDLNGNVGIGTTSPTTKLNVYDSTADVRIGNIGAGSFGGISFNGTLSVTDYNLTSSLSDRNLYINRPSGLGIFFKEANGTAQMSILSGGNVGIGTTTPNYKLVSTSATGPQLSLSAGAGLNQWVMRNEGGELAFATSTYTATSSVSALRIDSNGWGIWQMLKSIAKLIIPFGANPTVNTQGEIAIDTTAASSSLAFYDGTAERRLYTDNTKSFFISTSTLSSFNGTGTTTIEMKMVYRPTTIVAVSCKATTTGTAYLDFGDGTNWSNLVTCNTTGTYTNLSSNNTFVMGEMMKFRLGTIATLTQGFTISYVERQDAD